MYKIGIGVTVHNRNEIAEKSIKQIKKFAPKGAKIVVVDDGSEVAIKGATYRFEQNVGIPKAKNKCFELLDDCDYIFLFDDDCYPIKDGWHLPYIESGINHLNFTFDKLSNGRHNGNRKIIQRGNLIEYANPCGVMMMFTKKCLQVVGGFDSAYGKYGYEHPDLSNRIYKAGLIPARFLDIPNSQEYFYSLDQHMEVKSSVPALERAQSIKKNRILYNSPIKEIYKPYKEFENNIILTTYFTSVVDNQRDAKWQPDLSAIDVLINSVEANGCKLVLLHDCFDKKIGEKVKTSVNPYFQRWISIYEYLEANPKIDNVFCVDATDVEMLKNPFNEMKRGVLYTGDEQTVINNKWLVQHHQHEILKPFYRDYAKMKLLNAGVLGGSAYLVKDFCLNMKRFFETYGDMYSDMAAFNYVAYLVYGSKIRHGIQINTPFKSYTKNKISWFKHK